MSNAPGSTTLKNLNTQQINPKELISKKQEEEIQEDNTHQPTESEQEE